MDRRRTNKPKNKAKYYKKQGKGSHDLDLNS